MPNSPTPLILICHPATPAPAVRSVEVLVTLEADGGIALAYCLRGDMARLLIPPQQPGEEGSKRTDLLWEHTCFEAFIGVQGETAYREFNFSPSGQWASYTFADYRQAADRERSIDKIPQISARVYAGRLELETLITPAMLPPNAQPAVLEIGLSAVVEAADTVDGNHSYWALKHPSQRPDFHPRTAFTLQITR